ncbi:clavesin-1-like [Arctopsyche grandis]|uniref:clavesin-1-like n=1 Tax=Arctopsyche grandis TaxID=121162 RepID=UPI00406D8CB6
MTSTDTTNLPELFKYNVTPDAKEVALIELREGDLLREQCLDQMRDWISKHPAIKRCRTDSNFLLRFLRTKKFSVPQACLLLEKNLVTKKMKPEWFANINYDDPAIQDVINSGYLVPLPQRDVNNRRVVMIRSGCLDPKKHTVSDIIKTHALITELLIDDELNQIYGYSFINDYNNLTMSHVSMFSLTDIKMLLECSQNVNPLRNKANYFINTPSVAQQVLSFVISLLNDKMKKRFIVLENVNQLNDCLSPSILPKEYGGEVPLADMIDDLKKKLDSVKGFILSGDDMYIDTDGDYKLKSMMEAELGTGTTGSFRKLEVD